MRSNDNANYHHRVAKITRYHVSRLRTLPIQLRLAPPMPPNLRVKRRPAEATRTCDKCGDVFNVRGYGRHYPACQATRPTTPSIAIDTNPAPSEDGTFHTPQSSVTRSDTQITDGLAQADEIIGDLTEVDAEGSGDPIEAGGSGKRRFKT